MVETTSTHASERAGQSDDGLASSEGKKPLSAAAQRALAEADERRRQAQEASRPVEVGGRDGPEPVRYGDWERAGIAYDF